MLSAANILKITEEKISDGLHNSFPILSKTSPGDPVPLYDLQQSQQYWLVPFLLKSKVRGLAIFDLFGHLVSHGVLSPNEREENKLMDKAFFDVVPPQTLDQIKHQLKVSEFASHFLSYDETPRKWGWLLRLKKENEMQTLIFVGPQGWYEKKIRDDRERS